MIWLLKLGTGLSILIAKRNPSLVTTFALLSCGYLMSSYQEVSLSLSLSLINGSIQLEFFNRLWCINCIFQVKSVVLHTLNRARFIVAVESFLKTGKEERHVVRILSFLLFSCVWPLWCCYLLGRLEAWILTLLLATRTEFLEVDICDFSYDIFFW